MHRRRRLLIVLLALGTVGGFSSGFAHVARHHRHSCHSGAWGGRWEDRWEGRGDSRGPRESWESRAARGAAAPSAHVASPSEPPAPGEGAR